MKKENKERKEEREKRWSAALQWVSLTDYYYFPPEKYLASRTGLLIARFIVSQGLADEFDWHLTPNGGLNVRRVRPY